MNTSITYHGEVSIQIQNKKYIARNNASYELFNQLVSILGADNVPRHLPRYIGVIQTSNEYDSLVEKLLKTPKYSEGISILNRVVPVSATASFATESNIVPSITFEAALTQDMFVSNKVDDVSWKQVCLTLLAEDRETILAVVALKTNTFANLSKSIQAVVRWTLTFANTEETE